MWLADLTFLGPVKKRMALYIRVMKALKEEVYGIQFFMDELDVATHAGIDWSRNPLVSNDDFVKMMGISKRTAVRWRMSGKIRYVQVGTRVFYTNVEVERFISRFEKQKGKYIRLKNVECL